MIRVARLKAAVAGCGERIDFHAVPAEDLSSLPVTRRFDGVFSNFGVINCIADVASLGAALASRLAPGAPLLFVVMGRHVPWEWIWYLARGDGRRAFRRLSADGVEWRGQRVLYPTPGELAALLAPRFRTHRRDGLGFVLPPSYAARWLERAPRTLAVMRGIERVCAPFTAAIADHYILEATAHVSAT
jgi:SAM-dependent methyltransferase